ncbi:MAG: hypothetical protein OHK0022_18430 [Roseiflexaceae bacterium]
MGLEPTYTHRRGDRRSGRAKPYPHDMWQYEAPVDELKQTATVDVFLGYRSNCDHAGFSVPAASLAMFVELDIEFGVSVIIV